MLHRRPIISTATLGLLIAALLGMPRSRADDALPKFLQVKLILSDSAVLTNDGLAYKVVITNTSQSLVTICAPAGKPRYSCVLEGKPPGREWVEIWDYPRGMELKLSSLIQIPAAGTWAEYGQVYLTKGKAPVFDKEGNWELRTRAKTVIGEYLSDPVPLQVKRRPPEEEAVNSRLQDFGQRLLSVNTIPSVSLSKELTPLCKRHSLGGVAKTLKLIQAVDSYVETGKVAGKAATWSEAFKTLSVGLDEVRHDQLACLFAFGAMKKGDWKDLAFLVEQVDDNCGWLLSMRGELEAAIITGKFRP